MSRIFYDGYNLSLERGTGVATYARVLSRVARRAGHEVGIVYSSRATPAKLPLLREIGFYDAKEAEKRSVVGGMVGSGIDFVRCRQAIRPIPIEFSGAVLTQEFSGRLPPADLTFASRRLFSSAHGFFRATGRTVNLEFEQPPAIFHWTYQLPLNARKAVNIYTIHDLVPLRLPYATLDHKRTTYRMLMQIARDADHIVTVSEHSKRDIIRLLGVPEDRVTNTYEAVEFPEAATQRPVDAVADHLAGAYGLEYGKYLLFFGAMEPKKNLARLIEAYLAAPVDLPLLVVSGGGWQNEAEMKLLAAHSDEGWQLASQARQAGEYRVRRRIQRLEYVGVATLVTLIRGARAVLFPSLYEGFGLPVIEAMTLGTPVVTSRASSLPEIAGDAAILVDPYDVDELSRAIVSIASDDDLHRELVERGRQQAALFSIERYQERVAALYAKLL